MSEKTLNYWHTTHIQYPKLQSVGYVTLGVPFNFWMYKVREKKIFNLIANLGLKKSAKILDIGSGTGFYPLLWQGLGFKNITASDFAKGSLEKLRKLKKIKVKKIDIGAKTVLPKYDCITAFDILFHIVDDAAYKQAFSNIASALKKGGIFIFSENLLKEKRREDPVQVTRLEGEILGLLKKNNLQIVSRTPMFCLMNNPVISRNFLLKSYWRVLSGLLYLLPFSGNIFGPLLYPLEIGVTARLKNAPSTETIVTQKI